MWERRSAGSRPSIAQSKLGTALRGMLDTANMLPKKLHSMNCGPSSRSIKLRTRKSTSCTRLSNRALQQSAQIYTRDQESDTNQTNLAHSISVDTVLHVPPAGLPSGIHRPAGRPPRGDVPTIWVSCFPDSIASIPELTMACRTIVSIPIDLSSEEELAKLEEKGVRGRYTSAERIRELEDGKTEWLMATSSTPGGSIPTFIVERSVASSIAQVQLHILYQK